MCNSMGIDIGQKRSSSGICVAQTEWRESDGSFHFLIRRLERLPAGTPFPEIAGRVGEIAAGLVERGEDGHPEIYVNATGLGDPVVELIRDSADRSSMAISPVYFNYGDQRIEMERGVVSLGKAYLVSRLLFWFSGNMTPGLTLLLTRHRL